MAAEVEFRKEGEDEVEQKENDEDLKFRWLREICKCRKKTWRGLVCRTDMHREVGWPPKSDNLQLDSKIQNESVRAPYQGTAGWR